MSIDINSLELPLQKILDLGEIDRRLRDVAQFVPKSADAAHRFSPDRDLRAQARADTVQHDFNTYRISYGTTDLIEPPDIEKMVGFRHLINACSQANVCVNMEILTHGALEVSFNPDETFSRSQIFGTTYANVLPVMFGIKSPAARK
jgi:hypothetical protein